MEASDPNHNPIGSLSSSDKVFGYSSGDQSGSCIDKKTKDPYPMPVIKRASQLSEITNKDPSHVPKKMQSANTSNMLM